MTESPRKGCNGCSNPRKPVGLWTALFHRPLQESVYTVTVSSASRNSCLENKVLFTEPSQNCNYVTLDSKPSGIKGG